MPPETGWWPTRSHHLSLVRVRRSKTQGKALTLTWLTSKVLALLNLLGPLNNMRKGGLFKLQPPRNASFLVDLLAKSRTSGLCDNLEWGQNESYDQTLAYGRRPTRRQRELVAKDILTVMNFHLCKSHVQDRRAPEAPVDLKYGRAGILVYSLKWVLSGEVMDMGQHRNLGEHQYATEVGLWEDVCDCACLAVCCLIMEEGVVTHLPCSSFLPHPAPATGLHAQESCFINYEQAWELGASPWPRRFMPPGW